MDEVEKTHMKMAMHTTTNVATRMNVTSALTTAPLLVRGGVRGGVCRPVLPRCGDKEIRSRVVEGGSSIPRCSGGALLALLGAEEGGRAKRMKLCDDFSIW
jgi:hypothetical protein